MGKFEIVRFIDDQFELNVRTDIDNDTVWLSQEEMALLFDVDRTRITRHINNIYNEGELDKNSTCAKNAHMGSLGVQSYSYRLYNLDMIVSVGYRIKSQRGIIFRKWANKILKEYLIQGYAVNERRIQTLNKVVEIQNKMLASTLNIDTLDLKQVIDKYTSALDMLDDYDHHKIIKPKGNRFLHKLDYNDARQIIDSMKFNSDSNLFGVEKEEGKLNGILEAIYQNVFNTELYPTIEEKAAHLLYFIVKDHPFIDGCKRIGATLFLEFLNRNNRLIIDNKLTISNNTLVAITLLTAESLPNEKDVIINVIMHLLKGDRYD